MVERHVVTAFLALGEQILLLRRTDRVSTYKGRWAGVSGSVEAGSTPIEQAIQEIEEETGLSNADAIPVLAGQPFDFVDEALKRRWIVHPFRFRVSDEAEIRLDWEHSEAVWTEPAQLERLPTVPRLFDAWLRVAFLPQWIEAVARRNPRGSFLRSRRTGPPSARPTRLRCSAIRNTFAARLGGIVGPNRRSASPRPAHDGSNRLLGQPIRGQLGRHQGEQAEPAGAALGCRNVGARNLGIEADQLSDRLADDIANSLT